MAKKITTKGAIGLIASLIAIITFFTGVQHFDQLLEFLGLAESSKKQKANVDRGKNTELPDPSGKQKPRMEPGLPGVKRRGVSVMVTRNRHTVYWDLTHKISSVIKEAGGEVVSSSGLNNRFVSSGQFEQVFNGDPLALRRLGAGNRAAYLILGNQSVNYRQDSDYEGLITADAALEIHIVSSNQGTVEDSFTISNSGAGYTKADAERITMRNIMETLSKRLLEVPQLNLD